MKERETLRASLNKNVGDKKSLLCAHCRRQDPASAAASRLFGIQGFESHLKDMYVYPMPFTYSKMSWIDNSRVFYSHRLVMYTSSDLIRAEVENTDD